MRNSRAIFSRMIGDTDASNVETAGGAVEFNEGRDDIPLIPTFSPGAGRRRST
jgi:hypothetical protein